MGETVGIKILKTFAGYTKGDVIQVPSFDGLPRDAFWQRRLRDSAIDGCCELVKAAKKAKGSKPSSGEID